MWLASEPAKWSLCLEFGMSFKNKCMSDLSYIGWLSRYWNISLLFSHFRGLLRSLGRPSLFYLHQQSWVSAQQLWGIETLAGTSRIDLLQHKRCQNMHLVDWSPWQTSYYCSLKITTAMNNHVSMKESKEVKREYRHTLSFISSVQFSCSVVSDSLWPHGLQHARLPCPSPTPGACSAHVYRVGDAIQPSHPLSFFSSCLNLSPHQSFPGSSSHQMAEVLEFQLQHQSFQWIFRTDNTLSMYIMIIKCKASFIVFVGHQLNNAS